MNIIGDIAGQFEALMRLINKMPHEKTIFVGDMNDRGYESMQVIDWAMNTEGVKVTLGNHEHMMIDYVEETNIYHPDIWMMNGGGPTLTSYNGDILKLKEHVAWLKTLPMYIIEQGCFISHAPWTKRLDLNAVLNLTNFEDSIIWNRNEPCERDQFQIFGHNSNWGLRWFGDKDNPWAVCLDNSRKGVVTGMHWPSKKIYQEPYLAGSQSASPSQEIKVEVYYTPSHI